jgi:PAS domain S-box-containing protein
VTKIFNASKGNEEDYCVTIFPMRDLSQKFTGKIVFIENITDKILVEKQLRESEEKHRTLVETMNEGILVLNEDHVVTYINQKICALLGRSRDEIIGRNFEGFLHPDSRHDFTRQQLLRKEGYSDSYEFILVNKEGEKVFVLSSPTPLIDGSLNYNGSYEVITNISNLKLIEHQLIHSQKMETIGVMAAGLAHEINTPLQYAISNSTFVKETIDKLVQFITSVRDLLHDMTPEKCSANPRAIDDIIDEFDVEFITKEIPPAINECLEGLNRIASIVLSVKKFAHPDSDEFRPVNVNEEITTTINISRNEWKYVAEMECRLDENLPPLPCIASDFNQVILNLIITASHAVQEKYSQTAQKGTIRNTTSIDKHDLVISVSDNGAGIPQGSRKRYSIPSSRRRTWERGPGWA